MALNRSDKAIRAKDSTQVGQIGYILLCHNNVDAIIEQATNLTDVGDAVSIHFDATAPQVDYARLKKTLAANPNVVFPKNRRRCGWGEWSLVAATLEAAKAGLAAFPRATHFYLLSGDCLPIKSATHIHKTLETRDVDFIECFDFFESDWIKTGLREERLVYRHWFNERTRPTLFYGSMALQRNLRMRRKPPNGLKIMIGSQWWCLRRQTLESIFELLKQRPDFSRFFKSTWIPDETFFQTLVRHLVPEKEIECQTLTFLMFSDYGMPVTLYNDHYDLLVAQEHLFARKVSVEAKSLRERLGQLYVQDSVLKQTSRDGPRLFRFLTGRGRLGHRFANRFWETETTIGRDRTLLIVSCKKWHVAKRLSENISQIPNLTALDYIFDETNASVPELGGITTTREKRSRHRRALLRMLFDQFETDHLLICLDPSNLELIQDLYSDRCKTRLLDIACEYSDSYLVGHAKRVDLTSDKTSAEVIDTLLPSIRNAVQFESDRIHEQAFPNMYRIAEKSEPEENAREVAEFLGIAVENAHQIVDVEHLFLD